MINMAASWRAKRLLEFSVSRGGDWIDAEVARVRNLPTARVTYIKEKYLDFDNLDAASNDLVALDIYYEELIRYAVDNFIREYVATRAAIEEPLEIIVGGGTSLAPGFGRKFRDIIQTMDLPFRVKGIRIARDPLLSVASGALIAAMAEEKKTATGDVNRLSIGKAKAGEPAKAKPAAEIDTISLEVDNGVPERMKGKIPAKSTDATGESFSLDS